MVLMLRLFGRSSRCIPLVLVAAACGETTGSEAGKELASAFCDLASKCCSEGEMRAILGPYTTEEDCTDRILSEARVRRNGYTVVLPRIGGAVQLPNMTYLDRAIENGRIEVSEDALDRCSALVRDMVCMPEPVEVDPTVCVPTPELVPGCLLSEIFIGQVGEGGDCVTASGECAPGLYCFNLGSDGVCISLGAEGDFCDPDTAYPEDTEDLPDGCREGLVCSPLDGTCVAPAQLDESCHFVPCAMPLDCDPFSLICVAECQRGHGCLSDADCDATVGLRCIVGSCDSARALGQPCMADLDCSEPLRCEADGDPSNNYTMVCMPRLEDGEAGCVDHADCASNFCDPTSGTQTCQAQVNPGGDCLTGFDEQCKGGFCENGECEALVVDGGGCAMGKECESKVCIAGQCSRPPLADGQSCSEDHQCSSEFCNYETERYCDTRPLPDGRKCIVGNGVDADCASGVCVEGVCGPGLAVGADCGAGGQTCSAELYCDPVLSPPSCQPRRGPGEDCDPSRAQCAGACIEIASRWICDWTAPTGELVCDEDDAAQSPREKNR